MVFGSCSFSIVRSCVMSVVGYCRCLSCVLCVFVACSCFVVFSLFVAVCVVFVVGVCFVIVVCVSWLYGSCSCCFLPIPLTPIETWTHG